MIILWIVVFSILGSVGAIVTAASFLLLREKIRKTLIPCLVSFATGSLLTAALLGLMPRALNYVPASQVLSFVLFGIILFFLLEKMVIWRHCHDSECKIHDTAGPMILIGDAFHNATDGIIIATGFLISISIGLVTAISVIAHEIPQEVGDFAILLNSGYSKRKALLLNALSSSSTIPAAILAYYALDIMRSAVPFVMAISASSFLYIALTDLYPMLHQQVGFWSSLRQVFLMLTGICVILLLINL